MKMKESLADDLTIAAAATQLLIRLQVQPVLRLATASLQELTRPMRWQQLPCFLGQLFLL
jgi:hypothetical protein